MGGDGAVRVGDDGARAAGPDRGRHRQPPLPPMAHLPFLACQQTQRGGVSFLQTDCIKTRAHSFQIWNSGDFKKRCVVRSPTEEDAKQVRVQMMTEHKYKAPKLIVNCFIRYLRYLCTPRDLPQPSSFSLDTDMGVFILLLLFFKFMW